MIVRALFFLLVCCPLSVFAADIESTLTGPVDETSKIMGGVQAALGAWPWMATLLYANEPNTYQAQYCSGVLIEKSWVLTAAHCVQSVSAREIQVAVGAYDLSSFSGRRIPVKSIQIHPQYSNTFLSNDIALIELSSPSTAPTIALFSGQSNDNTPPSLLGRVVTVLGWGLADRTPTWYYPQKLRQVTLPVVADRYCNEIYSNPTTPSQFCAGYIEGKDACEGDSGGPAVVQVDDTWVHAGMVSSGAPCQWYYGWYGKYTRTSAYLPFIQQYVPNVSVTANNPVAGVLPSINLLLQDPEYENP